MALGAGQEREERVRERIRLLGGRFDVRSQPGGPTTVSLSLPRWRPLSIDLAGDEAAFPALVAE